MASVCDNPKENPLNAVLRSWIQAYEEEIGTFCSLSVFPYSPMCTAVLGILGMLLNVFNVWRIITAGPVLRNHFYSRRMRNGILSEEAIRDMKLITCGFSGCNYFFLILGLATNAPILFLPFLTIHSLIIFFETTLFTLRAIFLHDLDLQVHSFIMISAMSFNWISVACTMAQSLFKCVA